jgi:hypothetical protein
VSANRLNFNRKPWIDYIAEECGQGEEQIFAGTQIPGAIVEDNAVPRVDRDEGSPKSRQMRLSAHG